jgi:predicted nucleotidyltransferase
MEFYKKILNPNYWKNKAFDKHVREKILNIVVDFIREVELKVPIKDVTLTGSIANYNYNKYSDLDVHILLDFSKVDPNVKLVRDALDGKRFVWNLRHDIYIKGHEVELYFQDVKDPHHSTGIFSILRNKWLKEPAYNPPGGVDMEGVKSKAYHIADLVKRMENTLDTTQDKSEIKLLNKKGKLLKDKIIKIRKDALAEHGEFAFENLVFKMLRNEGIIERIISLVNKSYDKLFMESKFLTRLSNFLKHDL